jgi:hypothetical protein
MKYNTLLDLFNDVCKFTIALVKLQEGAVWWAKLHMPSADSRKCSLLGKMRLLCEVLWMTSGLPEMERLTGVYCQFLLLVSHRYQLCPFPFYKMYI